MHAPEHMCIHISIRGPHSTLHTYTPPIIGTLIYIYIHKKIHVENQRLRCTDRLDVHIDACSRRTSRHTSMHPPQSIYTHAHTRTYSHVHRRVLTLRQARVQNHTQAFKQSNTHKCTQMHMNNSKSHARTNERMITET